jgi:flagellar biosynthesis GTPase FlhF
MSGWDKKDIVFIAINALIAILALVGTAGVLTTTTEVKISSNYKTGIKALYAAKQAN